MSACFKFSGALESSDLLAPGRAPEAPKLKLVEAEAEVEVEVEVEVEAEADAEDSEEEEVVE